MINNVVLVGRITQDLELQTTNNGTKLVKFTLAFDSERPGEETNFMPCTAWTEQAERMCQFLGKGSLIGVQGRISVRKYTAANGEKRTFTEVVANRVNFLESKAERQSRTNEFSVSNLKPAPAATLSAQPRVEAKPAAPAVEQTKKSDETIDWLDSFL